MRQNNAASSSSSTAPNVPISGTQSYEQTQYDNLAVSDAQKLTDAEATEQEALDMAIQISRHEHLGWALEDLDASLAMTLGDKGSGGSGGGKTSASDSAHAVVPLTGEALSDATADLAAVQQDVLQTATAASEQEHLDQAILASLLRDGAQQRQDQEAEGIEQELLEQARLASLFTYPSTTSANAPAAQHTSQASSSSSYPADTDIDHEAMKLANLSDEEQMRLAIAKSLEGHSASPYSSSSSASAHTHPPALSQPSSSYQPDPYSAYSPYSAYPSAYDDDKGTVYADEDDALLQAAIQASLLFDKEASSGRDRGRGDDSPSHSSD